MKKALLIIDVQNAILSRTGKNEAKPYLDHALDKVVQNLKHMQEKARASSIPVIMIQHDGESGHRLEMNSWGWEIREEIAPKNGDIVIHKKSSDSFFETQLDQYLKENKIEHLIVGGCMTQYCVDTTVRRAVSLGYDVTLLADSHTTSDSPSLSYDAIVAHHNETLNGFDAGQAKVTVQQSSDVAL